MGHREVFDRVKRATVAVVGLNVEGARHPFTIIGSGFCIDPAGIVVTCRHVVDEFMTIPTMEQIKQPTGGKTPGGGQILPLVQMLEMYAVFYWMLTQTRLVALLARVTHVVCKTDVDLALLKLNPDQEAFPSGYPTLEIEDPQEIHEGDEIGTCGFPLGTFLHDQLGTVTSSFTRGIISSIIPAPGAARDLIKGFQLDLGATHGNSGGPIFLLESGRVFGVLEAGFPAQSGLGHLTKAAPIYPVLEYGTIDQLKRATLGEIPGELTGG